MIPFASQRGGGQNLATHLQNEHDNEVVELYDLRGSVAEDLEGAFAEWKAQADHLTRCKNYLYSLSVNPDHRQGELTKDQYMDFLQRVEDVLGLESQPRALVFHVKDGREHLHAVYSRIDSEQEKAVHMPFDHDKLMMVTRKFARDYNLQLPQGYSKERGEHDGKGQLLLHEKRQQDTTGISKEDRMAIVTDIWRGSDSASAFVAGLEDQGYILCTGRRDYVLVDYYGHMNSLPKLIDDRQVRTQQIRDFLGDDFPKNNLPDVDETRDNISEHRKRFEDYRRSQKYQHKIDQLNHAQKRRRAKLESFSTADKKGKQDEIRRVEVRHASELKLQRETHRGEAERIANIRKENRREGLTAFLAKASGLEVLEKALHRRQDRQRTERHELESNDLQIKQRRNLQELQYGLDAHDHDFSRKKSALDKLDRAEMQSLKTSDLKSHRVAQRKGPEHIPSAALELSPWGRKPNISKAKHKHHDNYGISKAHRQSVRGETSKNNAPDAKEQFQDHSSESQNEISATMIEEFFENTERSSETQESTSRDREVSREATRRKSNRQEKGKTRK